LEEEPDPDICVAAAAVHGSGDGDLILGQAYTDLLARLTYDSRDGHLAGFSFATGQVPLAIGEASALTQREQDMVFPGEQYEHIESAALRAGHRLRA
jgi:hypothetical protein